MMPVARMLYRIRWLQDGEKAFHAGQNETVDLHQAGWLYIPQNQI